MDESSYKTRVISWVERIPAGKVATYGQIAALAGKPRAPRQVGQILAGLANPDQVPWQRVINIKGEISTHRRGVGDLQQAMLESEGVCFDAYGRCDLEIYLWQPETEQLEGD